MNNYDLLSPDQQALFHKLFNQTLNNFDLEFACTKYLEFAKKIFRPKTVILVQLVINHLYKYFDTKILLSKIGIQEAEGFLFYLLQGAPSGAYAYHRHAKSMFNKFLKWGYVYKNPFIEISLPKRQKKEITYINFEEYNCILKFIKQPIVRLAVAIAYYLGMRLNEITNLSWKDVDLDKKIIQVGSDTFITKSKRIRIVPMPELIFDSLLELKNSKTKKGELPKYVLSKTKTASYTGDFISKKFKEAVKKSGVNPSYHFHSLRHGFASRLAQLGVPIVTISKLLGHSSITTTMIYQEVNMDDLRKAIEKL